MLPDETPAVREQFISGTCGICWDKMFPQDKEEEWFDSGPIKKEMLESWLSLINKEEKIMSEYPQSQGISTTTQCYNCLQIDDTCDTCMEEKEERDSTIAWEIIDDGNLQYKKVLSYLKKNHQTMTGQIEMVNSWSQ